MTLTNLSHPEEVLLGRNRVLQDLARGASLEEVLHALALTAEGMFPDMQCSVLLLDDERRHLRCFAAPSLPQHYIEAIDGIAIGPKVGSCPAAVATGERVIVEDIRSHPNWEGYRELAESAGLRSCWAEPILSARELPIGSFAMYYATSRRPTAAELAFIETSAHLAGIAIERSRTEAQLRDSEERFRQLAEHISGFFWLVDWSKKEMLFASPAYETIWGRSCESLRLDPLSWREGIHPDDRERVVSAYESDAVNGTYDVEYRVVRPDGEVHWVHDRAFPVLDADGGIYRMAGLTDDITENKRAELSLRESEERFRQLAENVSGIFWLTDWKARRVLYVSPTWERVWGIGRETLFGEDPKAWTKNIHPEDRQRVIDRFENEAERGTYDIDFRVVHPGGSVRWLHERAFPIRDRHGAIERMAGVAEDITDRKRVELELQAARDELEERRRSQIESLTSQLLLAEERERRKLARDLHDGMNQTVTLALLKLAQLKETVDEGLKASLAEIEALIDEVNRSSRSLTFQLSPPILHDIGFEPAVQWLVEDIQRTYGMAVELEGGEDPSPLEERVRVLLYRAVRELLINVAKHADAQQARVTMEREPGRIRICVEDDGVAFDPDTVGSRGLGLYGIRERLSHLGGSMTIESRPEAGTRVTLIAPIGPLESVVGSGAGS